MQTKQPIATRQELLKIKAKAKNAHKGRSLLKDKRDSLMKHFFATIQEAMALRANFEAKYSQAFLLFEQAGAQMDQKYLESLVATTGAKLSVTTTTKSIMSVKIPQLTSTITGSATEYSLSQTTATLDASLNALSALLPDILKLIEVEHAAVLRAKEIKKTRRRVNSLDYVVIPELEKNAKLVRSKREEQARDVTVALMKVKAHITQQS